eukprot:scaffold21788_cov109-Skeletonema_dohrnii-CCMP3373.AAC.4
MMYGDKMSSSDGVETTSDNLVGQKNPVKIACQDVIRDTADEHDTAEQREDKETASSFVRSSKMGNFVPVVGREPKPKRRHLFDDMHSHFCDQRAGKFHSSLAPPSHGEMSFGDLDFDADAAALGFGFEECDPTLYEQRAPLPLTSNSQPDLMNRPKKECARGLDQSSNDESVHDAQIRLGMEVCARGTGRRTR